MVYLNKYKFIGLLKKNILFSTIAMLFICFGCSSERDLITQPLNFQPDSYLHPNKNGIKNATEFFKKSDEVIGNSKFVPARINGGTKELISNVKFPYEARGQFQEGQVYLNLFIDETGEVVFIRVLESPDNRLTRYSIYAVRNTDFFPATLNDIPVKSTRLVMFNFNFKLDNDITY